MLHYQEILSNRITLLGNSYYAIQDGPIADYCSVAVQHIATPPSTTWHSFNRHFGPGVSHCFAMYIKCTVRISLGALRGLPFLIQFLETCFTHLGLRRPLGTDTLRHPAEYITTRYIRAGFQNSFHYSFHCTTDHHVAIWVW